MDRTSELFSIIEILKQTGTVKPSPYAQLYALRQSSSSTISSSTSSSSSSSTTIHNFLHYSRQLGKAIRSTQLTVLRLIHLVQRKGLFDDPAIEINDLTIKIKKDLQALDNSLQSLTTQLNSLSFSSLPFITSTTTSSSSQAQYILQTILDTLRGHILVITRMFQEALRIRSENMKEQANRRKQFASSRWTPNITSNIEESPLFANTMTTTTTNTALPNSYNVSNPTNTSTDQYSSTSTATTATTNTTNGLRKRSTLTTTNPQPSSLPSLASSSIPSRISTTNNQYSMQLATLHDARIRENDMKSIESTIVELGTMFTHMATVVAEQGDTINRIDADMDVISSNVEKGKNELTQFYQRISNQRQFIIKLFLLLCFIIILFGIFRPSTLSSSSSSSSSSVSTDMNTN